MSAQLVVDQVSLACPIITCGWHVTVPLVRGRHNNFGTALALAELTAHLVGRPNGGGPREPHPADVVGAIDVALWVHSFLLHIAVTW